MVILVILFIPIKRYTLPSSLPFHLEAVPAAHRSRCCRLDDVSVDRSSSAAAWATTRRQTASFCLCSRSLGSFLTNSSRVSLLEGEVLKRMAFFVSFFIILYMCVSVLRPLGSRRPDGQGSGLGAVRWSRSLRLLKARTKLQRLRPPFRPGSRASISVLSLGLPCAGARLRVYASAQHPIALGAGLVMLLPLTIYLFQRYSQRRYFVCGALILLAVFSTVVAHGLRDAARDRLRLSGAPPDHPPAGSGLSRSRCSSCST